MHSPFQDWERAEVNWSENKIEYLGSSVSYTVHAAYVFRSDLEAWLEQGVIDSTIAPSRHDDKKPPVKTTRGPRKGETGYTQADAALFPEIEALLANGAARSSRDAVQKIDACTIAGAGTNESKRDRLYRAYLMHKRAHS
jgi:hypothetical protein